MAIAPSQLGDKVADAPKSYAALVAGAAALAATALYVHHQARQAEARHPPEGRFLTIDGVKLHFRDAGEGPAVVLLHGNGATSEDFLISGLFDALATTHRVIAFDRPGYGYSERPRLRLWTPAAQASLLLQAMAVLGITKPVLVGHSWGTLVAIAAALDSPIPLRGLVLLSGYYFPTLRGDVPLFAPPALPIVGDVMRYTVSPLLGKALAPRLFRKLFAPRPVPMRFASEYPLGLALRPSQIRASAEETAMMIPAALRFRERYGEIDSPVVLFAGDADEVVDFHRQSNRLHQELPRSTLHRLPRVGHMVHYSAVEPIAAAVRSLAARTESAGPTAPEHRPYREWTSSYETNAEGRVAESDLLDQTMADSFPASDPPSYAGVSTPGSPRK